MSAAMTRTRPADRTLRFIILSLARWTCPNNRPTYGNTRAKCRIGTAKFFTLLLLLYHTSVKASGMTAVVLALLVGLYFLISGLQHKSATIHCQKIAQTPPPKQDFVGRGRSFYSFIYGNTAQFPPSGLSTASAAAARHLRCQNAR